MKDLLIQIAKALVDNPEQVQINEIEGSQTVVLELRVANTDMGRVIGKQGRTANAIRVLLSAASQNVQVSTSKLSQGVYYYYIENGDQKSLTKKMIVVKR